MNKLIVLALVALIVQPAEARGYRYAHHHRSYHHHRQRPHVRSPDRDVSVARAQGHTDERFGEKKSMVEWPEVNGTSVLDLYTGRRPVINMAECVNPDFNWYQTTRNRSWSASLGAP